MQNLSFHFKEEKSEEHKTSSPGFNIEEFMEVVCRRF